MILQRRVEAQEANMRLSRYLRHCMALAGGYVARLKPQNAILVDGRPVHTDYRLQPGQWVAVHCYSPRPAFPAEAEPLEILYEDDALLAVFKPPGLLSHPSHARWSGTLANRVLGYYDATGQACGVHVLTRLDRDTQGIVLLSKNPYIHDRMTQALGAGQIHKTYLAPVFGAPALEAGEWAWPIHRPDPRGQLRCTDPQGQRALTHYRILERHEGWSLLALQPETGRTHQLRVHCLAAGCPILGDPMYCTAHSHQFSLALAWSYQHLLAQALVFPHPLSGQMQQLTVAPPGDFLPGELPSAGENSIAFSPGM